MTKLDIKTIITRYLKEEATTDEIAILFEWVKKDGNQDTFKKLVQADYLVRFKNDSWDSEEAFQECLRRIKDKEETKIIPLVVSKNILKYAAAVIVLVASTTYYIFNNNSTDLFQSNLDYNEITFQLSDGKIINLDQNNDTIIKVGNGLASIQLKNGILTQIGLANNTSNESNNILKVPYGKTLSVTLDDGSIVKLNAGSELYYPSSFAHLNKRKVTLKGEAFFQITKNPLKPFVVQTDETFTQVYGTVFNISSYDEDDKIEVVLVEGSVGVGDKFSFKHENLTMLKPSQKITNSKKIKGSFVVEDVDVTPYISWIEGVMSFENASMSQITKKLERQFDVKIINENNTLEERQFTGAFDTESIESILKTIQTHTNFKYVIKGKIITIKKTE
jgi:transmembrane sensor